MRTGPALLLSTLLVAIAAHGLAPEALTPWRSWVVFKEFARNVAESPDPGVSVQITRDNPEGSVSLILVRQVVEPIGDWLEPVGGVVCEMKFPRGSKHIAESEEWSFESPNFDRFVDLVESSANFQELVVNAPWHSSVYWLDA